MTLLDRVHSSPGRASSPTSSFADGRVKSTPRIDAQWCPLVVRIDRFELENKLLLIVLAGKFLPIQEVENKWLLIVLVEIFAMGHEFEM